MCNWEGGEEDNDTGVKLCQFLWGISGAYFF